MSDHHCQKHCTYMAVNEYLESLSGHDTDGLYDLVLAETERGMIKAVLEWHKGNRSKTADTLGITRTTLRTKMRNLNIK
ncbi:helix-turn-helix domain-containing protein [Marinicella gelatinilytica]|uniref:helix-turn-helix domain-containing protein n=1 Tax=Marinicella gelatinilytica TaxID=2996017 RepID=UPI00226086D5|nr:helix-turn-helix domain-containing protein [Marinicella gelatinilytica]MCX7544531.1 hypothetical protein [Marinicella gelatinilytica]